MSNCYMCNQVLTEENRSEEHIVLNSIGGKLKSKNLLCKNCNSKFGAQSDAILSKQLNFYSNQLMIERDRGKPAAEIMEDQTTGELYKVEMGGKPQLLKPSIVEKTMGEQINLQITARNMKEARKILEGYQRKYPNIDIEEILNTAEVKEEYLNNPLHKTISIGGPETFSAILKTAINQYVELTGDIVSINDAIESLRNDRVSLVESIIMKERIFEIEGDEILHSIYINGSKEKQKLYCVIEYFTIAQFIIKLSDSYFGDDFESLYIYDVLSRQTVNRAVNYRPPHDFIFAFDYPLSNPDLTILKYYSERFMKIAMERQHEFYRNSIYEQVYDDTINKLIPDGGIITEEAAKLYSEKLVEKLMPYLKSLQRPNN